MTKTYEDGLVEGEIRSLQRIAGEHKDRLDDHSGRLRLLERALWVMFGVLALAQIWPQLQWLFKPVS